MTLLLGDDDVRTLLTMRECIEAMRRAFREFAVGTAVNRPRVRYRIPAGAGDHPHDYGANVHVGAIPSLGVACVRAGSTIRPHRGAEEGRTRAVVDPGSPVNWGIVILFSTETGEPLALLHEFYLSGLRVGATSALAVELLSPPVASVVGLFGTGKLAQAHVEAFQAVRPATTFRVFSPNADHRRAFCDAWRQRGVDAVAAQDAAEVVKGADIVCCCTNSSVPVFDGSDLQAGQLVISVANTSAYGPRTEVDRETIRRSRHIVVNDRESLRSDSQRELLDGLAEQGRGEEPIFELGELLATPGRAPSAEAGVTYYKNNTGLAIQFAAAGAVIYRRALEREAGRVIPTEWFGSDLSEWFERGYRPSP